MLARCRVYKGRVTMKREEDRVTYKLTEFAGDLEFDFFFNAITCGVGLYINTVSLTVDVIPEDPLICHLAPIEVTYPNEEEVQVKISNLKLSAGNGFFRVWKASGGKYISVAEFEWPPVEE